MTDFLLFVLGVGVVASALFFVAALAAFTWTATNRRKNQ